MKHISLITLLLTFSVLQHSFAQNSDRSNQLIYLNFPEYSVKAEVLSSKLKINTNNEFNYTWYAYNKILETKGGYDGRLLSGLFKSFYLNDNLKEQGYYKKGLKSGKWVSWNENGKIKEISTWKNGLRNGNTMEYNDKEELILTVDYKNDVLNGHLKKYENGKIIQKQKFKNGVEVIKKIKPEKEKKAKNFFGFLKRKPSNEEPEKVIVEKDKKSKNFFHFLKRKKKDKVR